MPSTSHIISPSQILSQTEINTVLAELHKRAAYSKTALVNLVIFRLSTFCGLRVSELIGLEVDDVKLQIERPFIVIRAEIAKLNKNRVVPIWSTETIADFTRWMKYRTQMGILGNHFVCSTQKGSMGNPINRQNARKQFISAVSALGKQRQETLTIHDGRHTMASMALAKNVPIAAVRDALGHSSISTTNIYTSIFNDGTRTQPSLDCA